MHDMNGIISAPAMSFVEILVMKRSCQVGLSLFPELCLPLHVRWILRVHFTSDGAGQEFRALIRTSRLQELRGRGNVRQGERGNWRRE